MGLPVHYIIVRVHEPGLSLDENSVRHGCKFPAAEASNIETPAFLLVAGSVRCQHPLTLRAPNGMPNILTARDTHVKTLLVLVAPMPVAQQGALTYTNQFMTNASISIRSSASIYIHP